MIIEYLWQAFSHANRVISFFQRKSELARAKRLGMIVGRSTKLVGHQSFGTEPFLIDIGKDCLVTDGVRFITHDGAIQVPYIHEGYAIEKIYGLRSTFGKIKIHDNCFIGIGAIILAGTEIGPNSIVGAGSVVRGVFPSGSVIAGNPAKRISSIEKYFEKNIGTVIVFNGDETAQQRMDFIAKNT